MEVLLVGNTDFITKQWIQHSFPRDHVVIAEREGTVDGNDRLRIVNMSDANTLAETLTTYEFDRIVFFSEGLTPRSERDGDLGYLRRLLHAIRNRSTQMLMVCGPESEFTYPENADVRDTSKSLMSRASEELCLYYAHLPSGSENHSLSILVCTRAQWSNRIFRQTVRTGIGRIDLILRTQTATDMFSLRRRSCRTDLPHVRRLDRRKRNLPCAQRVRLHIR